MAKYKYWSFLFLNYNDPEHSELFTSNIENYGYHTDIFDELDLNLSRNIFLFISTEKEKINYIAVGQRGTKIASKKTRFKIIKAFYLEEAIVDTRFILSSTGVFAELFSQVTRPFYK